MTERHHRIAHLTAKLTRHADTIANVITGRQPGDPIEIRRPERTGRTTGIPRPVESPTTDWEDAQLRDATRLIRLLTGHTDLPVRGAAEIANQLDHPVTRYDLELLAVAITRGNPSTAAWRACVRDVGLAWHEAASAIHDGWTFLHASRWVTDDRGLSVLDDMAEIESLEWIDRIAKLEKQLHTLLRRVTPAKLTLCAGGCRRPVERDATDGLCAECDVPRCADGCGRQVTLGQGATHPACRQRKHRDQTV